MIVHKVVEIQVSHILEIFYSMGDLEIVMIIVSTVECFVQCVVCYAVKSFSVYPAAVISVDDLAHKPEIFFYFCCCTAQGTHEIEIKNVCCVKADSIYIKFGYPETDHIADVILYFRISLI